MLSRSSSLSRGMVPLLLQQANEELGLNEWALPQDEWRIWNNYRCYTIEGMAPIYISHPLTSETITRCRIHSVIPRLESRNQKSKRFPPHCYYASQSNTPATPSFAPNMYFRNVNNKLANIHACFWQRDKVQTHHTLYIVCGWEGAQSWHGCATIIPSFIQRQTDRRSVTDRQVPPSTTATQQTLYCSCWSLHLTVIQSKHRNGQ